MHALSHNTIRRALRFSGIGLHCGLPSDILLLPRPTPGITFHTTLKSINAIPSSVCATNLTTTLSAPDRSVRIHTVEHLLAALAAYSVTSLRILVLPAAPSAHAVVPILDGSAVSFCDALYANLSALPSAIPRPRIRILRPVFISDGPRTARFLPAPPGCDDALHLRVSLYYARARPSSPLALPASFTLVHAPAVHAPQQLRVRHTAALAHFAAHVAPARTFCLADDLGRMREAGLARGGSLLNAVVFTDTVHGACLSACGLRMPNEPAAHKLLDCVGDLSLAPGALVGQFEAHMPGHEMNRKVLAELLSNSKNYDLLP